MKCYCGNDAIISAVQGFNTIGLCQLHYKVACIKDMIINNILNDVCDKCNTGLLIFDGIGVPDRSNVIVTFKCNMCFKYKSVKKSIDGYFKKKN